MIFSYILGSSDFFCLLFLHVFLSHHPEVYRRVSRFYCRKLPGPVDKDTDTSIAFSKKETWASWGFILSQVKRSGGSCRYSIVCVCVCVCVTHNILFTANVIGWRHAAVVMSNQMITFSSDSVRTKLWLSTGVKLHWRRIFKMVSLPRWFCTPP